MWLGILSSELLLIVGEAMVSALREEMNRKCQRLRALEVWYASVDRMLALSEVASIE